MHTCMLSSMATDRESVLGEEPSGLRSALARLEDATMAQEATVPEKVDDREVRGAEEEEEEDTEEDAAADEEEEEAAPAENEPILGPDEKRTALMREEEEEEEVLALVLEGTTAEADLLAPAAEADEVLPDDDCDAAVVAVVVAVAEGEAAMAPFPKDPRSPIPLDPIRTLMWASTPAVVFSRKNRSGNRMLGERGGTNRPIFCQDGW